MKVFTRRIPGLHWLTLFASPAHRCDPGHAWMYARTIRRDVWRIGPIRVGWIACPRHTRPYRPEDPR